MLCAEHRAISIVVDRDVLGSPPQEQRKAVRQKKPDHHPKSDDHDSTGPIGVCDQSIARISAPISPPPARRSAGPLVVDRLLTASASSRPPSPRPSAAPRAPPARVRATVSPPREDGCGRRRFIGHHRHGRNVAARAGEGHRSPPAHEREQAGLPRRRQRFRGHNVASAPLPGGPTQSPPDPPGGQRPRTPSSRSRKPGLTPYILSRSRPHPHRSRPQRRRLPRESGPRPSCPRTLGRRTRTRWPQGLL